MNETKIKDVNEKNKTFFERGKFILERARDANWARRPARAGFECTFVSERFPHTCLQVKGGRIGGIRKRGVRERCE